MNQQACDEHPKHTNTDTDHSQILEFKIKQKFSKLVTVKISLCYAYL